MKQLEEKDRQLAAKDQQISDLIEKLDQEQKLHAMTQGKILQLEDKQDNESPETKKKFWQFWK